MGSLKSSRNSKKKKKVYSLKDNIDTEDLHLDGCFSPSSPITWKAGIMENTAVLEDSPRLVEDVTETQVLELDDDPEVVHDLFHEESVRTQSMSGAYNDTVVNSGKTESNTTEVLEDVEGSSDNDTSVVSQTPTVNREITQLNATPSTSGSARKWLASVRTASLRASGLAAAHKTELSINNRRSFHTSRNCDVFEPNQILGGGPDGAGAPCEEDVEKGTEGNPHGEVKNGWSARNMFPDTELAGLSYVYSQEPGEESQANALETVDRLLMASILEMEEEAYHGGGTASRKSDNISSAKGARSVANKRSDLRISGKSKVFDWDNSREDEGGGDIFRRRRDDFLVSPGRPGKPRRPVSEGRGDVHEKIMKAVHSELRVSPEKGGLGENLAHDLHRALPGPSVMNTEAVDDIFEVRFDTQMAAEAMEALSNGQPFPVDDSRNGGCGPSTTKRKSKGKALYSSPRRKPRTPGKPKTCRKVANPNPEKSVDSNLEKRANPNFKKRENSNPDKPVNLNPEKRANPNPEKRVDPNPEKRANRNPEKWNVGRKNMEASDSGGVPVALRTRKSTGKSGRGEEFDFLKDGKPWEMKKARGKRVNRSGPDLTIIRGKRTRRGAPEKVEKEGGSERRQKRSELDGGDELLRSDVGREASSSGCGDVGPDGKCMMNPCVVTGSVSAFLDFSKVDVSSGSACVTPAVSNTPVVADSPVCKGNEYLWFNPLLWGWPKGSRRRRDITSVRVVFSHHLDDDVIKQQKKILARLGASEASSMMDGTHFVADRFVRTKNMLEAIALGKPVVTHLWLENCGQVSCFIDEKNCILRDARKEKEIGFSMPTSLQHARQSPLLRGRTILITPSTKPGKEVISGLVRAVHGQAVERIGRSRVVDDLLILSCEEDRSSCLPYIQKGAAAYSSELLLNGIIIQKLELERHQLFLDCGS